MNDWICAKCGHEFPDDQAELHPDRISMVVIVAVGSLMTLAGLGMVIAFFLFLNNYKLIIYGPLIALMSLPIIGFGLKCGKGIKTICPSCGKPLGFRLDSKFGKDFQKQFKKKRA